jgi:hypothetical protein
MDLNAYLLNSVVEATAPPNEPESAAGSRADAILEMVCAFDPRDGMEAMIACHCVMLQFLLTAAMRDASNVHLEPAVLARARAGAISVSRALHQWVTKFENVRKRNEARAAEEREAAQSQAAPVLTPVAVTSSAEKSPNAPVTPPCLPAPLPAERAAIHVPSLNGRAATAAMHPGNLPPPAAASLSLGTGAGPSVPEADRTVTG